MELHYLNSRCLHAAFKAICSISGNLRFEFNEENFKIKCLDPGRISMVNLTIPVEDMDDYVFTEKSAFTFYDLDMVIKSFKAPLSKESLVIKYEQSTELIGDSDNKREIIHRNIEFRLLGNRTRTLKFDCDEVLKDSFTLKESDVETNEIELSPKEFRNIVMEAIPISDYIILVIKDNEFYFTTDLHKTNKRSYESKLSEDATITTNVDMFLLCSLDHLKNITSCYRFMKSLKLTFAPKRPLVLDFELKSGGDLRFALAPRLMETDFDKRGKIIDN